MITPDNKLFDFGNTTFQVIEKFMISIANISTNFTGNYMKLFLCFYYGIGNNFLI